MKFDELANDAGKSLADATRQVEVPEFPQIMRRRRQRALGQGLVAVILLTIGTVAVLATVGNTPNNETREPITSVSTSTPNATPASLTTIPGDVAVTPISLDRQIALTVLAVRPNNPSLAILDLEDRTTTIYPPGAHALPLDATDGAVMTAAGDLIVWTQGVARLFSGSLDQIGVELGPNPPRSISGFAPALRAVPNPQADQVWLVQPGIGYGDNEYSTLVELVTVQGGEILLSMELDPNAFPVAASGTGLVVNTRQWFDMGDGFVVEPGSEFVDHLLADGTIVRIGPGTAIASSTDRVVRLACLTGQPSCDLQSGENILVVTDTDGGNAVEVSMNPDETTLDTYGHLFDGLDEAAADRLDAIWRAARADAPLTRRQPEVIQLPAR